MTAFGDEPSRYNDLKIENNVIDNVGGLGIANQSSYASITSNSRYPSLNIIIRGNIISNTGRNNMIIRASDGAIVEHNTLINSSRYDTGHSVFCFNLFLFYFGLCFPCICFDNISVIYYYILIICLLSELLYL